MLEKLQNLKGLFFNTPMVILDVLINGHKRQIFAKYEALSFSGSIKDRMAYYLFEKGYQSGELKPSQPIIEATSGNTGIALSLLGRALGHPVYIVMPDWLSKERYQLMKLANATVIKVSDKEKGFVEAMHIARSIADEKGYYYPDQFSNDVNTLAHKETTAYEIDISMNQLGYKANRFVAAYGSGGTLMGIHKYYQASHQYITIHPLEIDSAPILSSNGEVVSDHQIQGYNGEFISKIMHLDELGSIISINEKEALSAACQLNQLGLSVGFSSGANIVGAIELLKKYPDDIIVTTLADSALKYLSSNLYQELVLDQMISNEYRLLGFSSFKVNESLQIMPHSNVQFFENTLQ
ncbi:cysteine synthase family protein [Thiotrichales bacterium 19S11-10]|nr:cysteine synthase family protein [Thiotrichales bacterium 19S11-10]